MKKEIRETKALLNKSGGKRGGSTMTRVTIPAKWAREMGIDEDNKGLTLSFDGEKLTITKSQSQCGNLSAECKNTTN